MWYNSEQILFEIFFNVTSSRNMSRMFRVKPPVCAVDVRVDLQLCMRSTLLS